MNKLANPGSVTSVKKPNKPNKKTRAKWRNRQSATAGKMQPFQLPNRFSIRKNVNELDAIERLFSSEKLFQPKQDNFFGDPEKFEKFKKQIANQSDAERRKTRQKNDLRFSIYKSAAGQEPPNESPCLHHVGGYCNHHPCHYAHHMRLPKTFDVCKFFITKTCTKGNSCMFMHEEYPCRFYYLGLPHPKSTNPSLCRFQHGDVLNDKTREGFLKSIDFWVREKFQNNPMEFERQMTEMVTKFEEQSNKIRAERETDLIGKMRDRSVIVDKMDAILTPAQRQRLHDENISSIRQLQNTSMEELERFGLTIDQIYDIKLSAADDKPQQTKEEEDDGGKQTKNDETCEREETKTQSNSFFYVDTFASSENQHKSNPNTVGSGCESSLVIDHQ